MYIFVSRNIKKQSQANDSPYCPNLKNFEVLCGLVSPISTPINPVNLTKLTDLNITLCIVQEPLAPGFLLQILQAPKLQRLELSDVVFQADEAEKIVTLAQNGLILRNLFEFTINPVDNDDDEYVIKRMVANLALHCPNLKDITYAHSDFFDERYICEL